MKGKDVVNALYKAMSENPDKKVLELSNFICIKEEPQFCVYCDSCPVVETCAELKTFSK